MEEKFFEVYKVRAYLCVLVNIWDSDWGLFEERLIKYLRKREEIYAHIKREISSDRFGSFFSYLISTGEDFKALDSLSVNFISESVL